MNDLRHHLKYTPDHLWISVEGTSATVGLTAWAVEELGEIEAVRFPPSENIPESLEAGECVAVIECDNGELDICLPLSGSNFETNAILAEDPELITEAPYDDGWLFKFTLADAEEADDLMDAQTYEAFSAGPQ